MAIETVDEALAILSAQRVLPMTGAGPLSSLVTLVAGGPVRGSWWGHPRGKAIFRIASALDDHPDVLPVKLVEGRVTFVHRALWPALLRVVTDEARRSEVLRTISPAARSLLARIDREGSVALDGKSAAKAELEEQLLALSRQVHTDAGRHRTELESWSHWMESGPGRRPMNGSLDEARAEVQAACAGEAIDDRPASIAQPARLTTSRRRAR